MQTSSSRARILVRGPGLAVYLALLGVFGVLLPWQRGLEFLDPVILTAYACLGGVFAGPAAVQLFENVPGSPRAALGRVAAAVAFAEVVVVILLALGLLTVRLMHPGIFPFDAQAMAAGLALGTALTLALAAMAAWIRTAHSATAARSALRAVLLALLIAFVFRSRWLPDVAWMGAGACVVVAAIFLVLLAQRVRAHARTQAGPAEAQT